MQRKSLNWKMAAPGAMPMSAWAWLNSMPTKTWAWHPVLAAILMLATAASTGRADSPPAKTDAPQPLPENIVTAWKDAGAEVGWLRLFKADYFWFVWEEEGKPGDLPAFHFHSWQEGRLAKLPAPAPVFGLSFGKQNLGGTQVTDAGLKELREALPGCEYNGK